MALKAVDADGRIAVAGLAELPFAVHRLGLAGSAPGGVAVYAARQTVLGTADTVVNRLISLMLEELHMVPTDYRRILHAALAVCHEIPRLRPFGYHGRGAQGARGQGH